MVLGLGEMDLSLTGQSSQRLHYDPSLVFQRLLDKHRCQERVTRSGRPPAGTLVLSLQAMMLAPQAQSLFIPWGFIHSSLSPKPAALAW